jgi:hypothetical protein
MNRVAEGIKDSRHLLVDVRMVTPDVHHEESYELRECAKAVSASPADYVAFTIYDVTESKVINVRTYLHNLANKLVADRHGHRDCALCPFVPAIDMDIGSADAGVAHPDENVIDADGRHRNVLQPQSFIRMRLYIAFIGLHRLVGTSAKY